MANNFNINNFNNFLQQAQETLMCDSQCQQQKKAQQLQQAYENAQVNLQTAPGQVDTTQKEYITFTQGTVAYSQMHNQDLTQKAQKIVSMYSTNFNNEAQQAKNNVATYSGLLNNYNNVYELYKNLKTENAQLKKDLTNKNSDVLTNDRKTYYENQEIDFLDYIYKYVLQIIYWITVVVYFISVFVYPSQFNWKLKLAVLIVLIGLPFVSTWLLSMIMALIYKVYGFLPKNVYIHL